MHVHHAGFRIKGLSRVTQFGPRWEMTPNEAQHRLTMLQFFAPSRVILSDNGSECLGHFQQRLDERGITHWWTYPRSPTMNAHAERFNLTLREPFVDYHEDLLFDDVTACNRPLADWLMAYPTIPCCPTRAWADNLRAHS